MTTSQAERHELRDTVRRALGSDPEAAPVVDPAWRTKWSSLVEIGVLALCAPEEVNGFGNESGAALLVSRELGASLHGSPYAAALAATYALCRWYGPDDERLALAERVLSGAELPVLAFLDPGSELEAAGSGLRLRGCARLVEDAGDSFLLAAPDRDGFLRVTRNERCTVRSAHAFDVTRSCSDIEFHDAPADFVDVPTAGRSATERLHGLLLAGDALGGVETVLARTTTYPRARQAFGKAIGGFQAVQHRLVDHAVRLRGLSLLAADAADRLAVGAPGDERQVLLTEAGTAGHAVAIFHDLLQLTGAIGFTWEYGLHFYERRAHLDARLARNPRQALSVLARHEGWPCVPSEVAGPNLVSDAAQSQMSTTQPREWRDQ
jgi:alkylation response protein AidB-like acyl-CoA dehydrogenase